MMGQERIIVSSKNWQAKREVQYWTRLLNITESEAQDRRHEQAGR